MKRISVALVAGLLVTALCAAQSYPGADVSNFRQEGIASWYGTEFDGRPTASGEVFNSTQYTAAHPTLPFGTLLTVTNLNNGRKVNVRVNDRGPFVSSRIIDLSQAAAVMLDMAIAGTAPVLVESMGQTTSQGSNPAYQAETNSRATSEGGYSTANSQIVAPYPTTTYQPTYEPSYQQTPQPAPSYQQQPQQVQQAPQQQYQQTQPVQQPVQQAQPVQQQILPVQQVIQPMQPIVAAPITTPQAAAPVTTAPAAAAPQQVQPLQINIPIEVRPVVTESAAPAGVPEAAASIATAPAAAAPATAAPKVQPNKIYRVQVGSYKEARNALGVFERLKNAGLDPLYERNGDYFRVVLAGIPSEEVNGVLQKLGSAGFSDPLLREER